MSDIELLPNQQPPAEPWNIWDMPPHRRGSGSTFAAAHFIAPIIEAGGRVALISSHLDRAQLEMMSAESGLRRFVSLPDPKFSVERGPCFLWENGARADFFRPTDRHELVGRRYAAAWWEGSREILGGRDGRAFNEMLDELCFVVCLAPGKIVIAS